MIIPLYQAELCHPSIRGRVTALQQFMLGIGSLMAAWISYGSYIGFSPTDDKQWRVSLGIQVAPAGLLAALILLFPESPRWLIDKGRVEKGLQTLAQLHAHGDTSDPWVRAEFDQIQESITVEREGAAKSYLDLFKDRSSFRRLFLACGLQASVQMTGVSAIQYYSVAIYEKIGIAGDETLRYQAISSVLALVAQFMCILFIDKTGRRWPLICGNLANCLCFIIATILLAKFPPGSDNSNGGAAWGFIVMTWLYNISFSATCGPLSWIIPAEIFDLKTRSKGVSIATMTSFAFNTMIGQTTSVALDDESGIGWRWYILFIVSLPLHSTLITCRQRSPLLIPARSATSPTPSSSGPSSPRRPRGPSRRCATSSPRPPGSSPPWTAPSSPSRSTAASRSRSTSRRPCRPPRRTSERVVLCSFNSAGPGPAQAIIQLTTFHLIFFPCCVDCV